MCKSFHCNGLGAKAESLLLESDEGCRITYLQ